MRLKFLSKPLLAAATAVVLLGGGTADANHIVVSVLLSIPQPSAHGVSFVFVEKESSLCCFGQPVIQFGDNTLTCLCTVGLNQDTPPGVYQTDLLDPDFNVIGTQSYTVAHALAPPLPNSIALNTEVTFSHTYPAAGLFTAKWHDCCFGTPQSPVLHDTVQPIIDQVFDTVVHPTLRTIEGFEPAGVDQGTLEVVAL